jgi:hypothetical protein
MSAAVSRSVRALVLGVGGGEASFSNLKRSLSSGFRGAHSPEFGSSSTAPPSRPGGAAASSNVAIRGDQACKHT